MRREASQENVSNLKHIPTSAVKCKEASPNIPKWIPILNVQVLQVYQSLKQMCWY
jgi:hypothetical protein